MYEFLAIQIDPAYRIYVNCKESPKISNVMSYSPCPLPLQRLRNPDGNTTEIIYNE